MYKTLYNDINQHKAAKISKLLERGGLHPLILSLQPHCNDQDERRYSVKLSQDELDRARQLVKRI